MPGEDAMQEVFESLNLGQLFEQADGIERIVRRPEAPGFGRFAQPGALIRQTEVIIVVADG